MGFAIPSNLVRAIAEAMGISEQGGVLVNQVNPGSPAELPVGDLITTFDGVKLNNGVVLRTLEGERSRYLSLRWR